MATRSNSWVMPVVIGVLLLALAAQSAMLYPKLRKHEAHVADLQRTLAAREEAEHNSTPPSSVQADELARLRKDNQELHRLRNEVRQLRDAAQQAAKTAQAAPPAGAPSAALVNQLQQQIRQLQQENHELRAGQQAVLQRDQAQADLHTTTCINNLRQLDGAKQQWALENQQPAEAVPEPADLQPYIGEQAHLWGCPAGGVYNLNSVGMHTTCSVPGHAL